MIKSIHFENFFSFKDTTIELHKGENILIGINGSGKSNLLKAIRLLKEGVAGMGLKKLIIDTWGGFNAVCFRGVKDNKNQESVKIKYILYGDILKNQGLDVNVGDIYYDITIHRVGASANYYVSEYLHTDMGWLLNFENGEGNLDAFRENCKISVVSYGNYRAVSLTIFYYNR